MGEFLFRGQPEYKEWGQNHNRRPALSVGHLSKGRVSHGQPQTGQGGDHHEGPVHQPIVEGRRRDFLASVFGSESGHG